MNCSHPKHLAMAHQEPEPVGETSTPALISDSTEMEDLADIPIHEPPSSGPRRSARHGHPPKGLQPASSELLGLKGKLDRPSVSSVSSSPTKRLRRRRVSPPPKKRLGRPPLSPRPSRPKKRPGRNRHIHEWLLEEDDGNEPEVQTEDNAISDVEENKSREPEPHIMIILSSLDLRVVPLQSRNQQGLPYWFIACTRCLRGLEPDDAVTHAAGPPSRGGHNIKIPQAQRRELRKWIEDTADLCSAQKMPPLPNPHGPPIPFIQTAEGYKCNSCSFCSRSKNAIGFHTGTVPGHSTARKATLQHLFHNRLLFAVQPDRHNEGRGNADGVDIYSLYAKQYKLDVEDESTTCVPLCSDDKEMPMLLQVTRWHDHLWKYLKNDGDDDDDSSEEKDDDSSEEKDDDRSEEKDDDASEEDEWNSDDQNEKSDNNSYKYRRTGMTIDEDSELTQTGRKRSRRSLVPQTSSKRRKELVGSHLGREPDDSDADSEDNESEEAHVGEKRNRARPSIQSGKRRKVNSWSDSETDDPGDLNDPDFSDFSQAEASDDDVSGDDSGDEEDWVDDDVERVRSGVSVRVSKRDQQRWEKWGTLTSVSRAKALFSIHVAGTTQEAQKQWHGKKLRETIICYMEKVNKKVIRGDLEIRHVLAGPG
jgi:Orsellinic acid/F9775 biosynthesis cluster protein D